MSRPRNCEMNKCSASLLDASLVLWLFTTLLSQHYGCVSAAYIGSSSAMAQPHQRQPQQSAAAIAAAELLATNPLGSLPFAMRLDESNSAQNTGRISFQPHDNSMEQTAAATRDAGAIAYDPGDELLRALNAELAASGQELGTLPEEPDYADTVINQLDGASKFDMLKKLENELREEQEYVTKSAMLVKLLEDNSLDTLPVIYVEEATDDDDDADMDAGSPSFGDAVVKAEMSKRSRYYRRFPWKRHNRNRSNYDPELRYACTPTKQDVYKLLLSLHNNHEGKHKTVNFCNRKRPAKAVFTNIRFLG